jgi:DNA-binding MarR family transcriptional regulator
VDELEELGAVTRRPPDDGRAKIVEYKPETLEIFEQSRRVIAAIERRWKRQFGAWCYEAMPSALVTIAGGGG